MNLLKKAALLFSVFAVVACNENYMMYRSYQHIPREGWSKSDTLEFDLSITDSLSRQYSLYLLVRNRFEYKYQYLALAVESNFPDSTVWAADTLVFHIADSCGNWQGKGMSGLYEHAKSFSTSRLNQPGNFTFKVTSLMADTLLIGINDIGVIAREE